MKKILYLIFSLATLTLGCDNKPAAVVIDHNLLKHDWISVKDKYDNSYRLFIEDSLMFETLFGSSSSVLHYKLSGDTLLVFPRLDEFNPNDKEFRVLKYKVVSLDSIKLVITKIYPDLGDTYCFYRQPQTKKNDLKIDRLELFFTCFGSCSTINLRISADSIIYVYGYNGLSKRKGLSKLKLSAAEFSRIQNRINSIDLKDFQLCISAPGGGYYSLYIKSQYDPIKIDGTYCPDCDENFAILMVYLRNLDRFLNLEPADGEEISFHYKPKFK